jgi:carbamoyl-phosphate synthase large subunit
VPFEFNARFSGTTCIRANFGFNEPEMFIRNYFFKRKINIPKINKGCCFRYLEEIFIKNCNSKSLIKNFSKGTINKWF